MGSDLFMNPPTADERRYVVAGPYFAKYFRHTDGIYRGGTQTWFRKGKVIHDPTGKILANVREVHPAPLVTKPVGTFLEAEFPYDVLADADRDWEREEAALRRKVQTERDAVDRATMRLHAAERELAELEASRG